LIYSMRVHLQSSFTYDDFYLNIRLFFCILLMRVFIVFGIFIKHSCGINLQFEAYPAFLPIFVQFRKFILQNALTNK
jgi:hypothetical protein